MNTQAMNTTRASTARTIAAGLAGGLAMNLAMLATFRAIGFGWHGDGILIRSPMQSPKLVAVWTELQPLPMVVANPLPIVLGLLAFGVAHAFVYRACAVGWPAGVWPRIWRLAALLFVVCFAFWEFFTPFNLFGEPWPLILLELGFWAVIALAEAAAIVAVIERGAAARSSPVEVRMR